MTRMTIYVLCFLALFTGCEYFPVTDYQQGYYVGKSSVRELRAKMGIWGQATAEVSHLLQISGDSSKSADWNAGFRAGLRDEMKEYYK